MTRWSWLASLALVPVACVPADEAVPLGSVAFTMTASPLTLQGIGPATFVEGWELRFDRVLLSFKTMTVGKIGDPERCAYRGRGATSDVVFDPRRGLLQTFNGIAPTDCPDVGIVLGPPGDATVPAAGASPEDLLELAAGTPAHVIVEGEAKRAERSYRLALRFDSVRAATEFGGCRTATARGVRILPDERQRVTVAFAAEALFRESISVSAALRFAPFVEADADGDGDGVITMFDLDSVRLASVAAASALYQLPDGTTRGTFGDYVRAQLRFAFQFGDRGQCVGNERGAP